MNAKENTSIKILMLPWLAHGHTSPFLDLAKALTKRKFYIHLCSTPINLQSIKEKLTEKERTFINLVEMHLPSLPDLPSLYHTTNGLPPHLMLTLKKAFDMAKETFATILHTINPDLLIYDFLQPWAPELASSCNIPSVLFISFGATASCYLDHVKKNPSSEFPFPAIYIRDHEKIKIDELITSFRYGIEDSDRLSKCIKMSCGTVLIRTSGAIEGKYIDYFSVLCDKKVVPVGSLVQEQTFKDERPEIIQWLDEKGNKSTVFASFGSEYFLSKEEMEEIAHGLELSGVNFIWVVRFHLGENIMVEEAMPKGFFERTKGKGRIIEGWAPQVKILRHGSIGGFLSHCGWSSVMESIEFGVPILALPMQLDQPLNSRLVEEVGVGVEVKRDGNGRVEREEVARVTKEVVWGEKGEIIRRKARQLGEEMRKKGKEDNDVVVEELLKLSSEGKKEKF